MTETKDYALKLIEENFTIKSNQGLGKCFECKKCKTIVISVKDALRHLRYHKLTKIREEIIS